MKIKLMTALLLINYTGESWVQKKDINPLLITRDVKPIRFLKPYRFSWMIINGLHEETNDSYQTGKNSQMKRAAR